MVDGKLYITSMGRHLNLELKLPENFTHRVRPCRNRFIQIASVPFDVAEDTHGLIQSLGWLRGPGNVQHFIDGMMRCTQKSDEWLSDGLKLIHIIALCPHQSLSPQQ